MSNTAPRRPVRVLLVEDDPGDVELTREMMLQSKLLVDIDVVEDGVKALAYLRREPPYADAPEPDLVLLDLNLPLRDGREVLNDIKGDDRLKHIPVVVLTTSEAEEDVFNTYHLGANCYVTKPVGLKQFETVVQSIEWFWFAVVKLPSKDSL